MMHYQDIGVDEPIVAGEYTRITADIYTDDTKTVLDPTLATGVITWTLMGGLGDLVVKTSETEGGITVDSPTAGSIIIEILEVDTEGFSPGEYTHRAEIEISSHKKGLFEGIFRME
jgi:hypothetical protein